MTNDTEIVVREDTELRLGALPVSTPREIISTASDIATQLRDVIESQGLYSTIGRKKHVHVEGWTTCAAMLGVMPRAVSVTRDDDGTYHATVELVRAVDGQVIGRGIATCGVDERRWSSAEEYARESMAITRATGKACRLAFSWIITLAGYNATPAEEIPRDTRVVQEPGPDFSKQAQNSIKMKQAQQVLDAKRRAAPKVPENMMGLTQTFLDLLCKLSDAWKVKTMDDAYEAAKIKASDMGEILDDTIYLQIIKEAKDALKQPS